VVRDTMKAAKSDLQVVYDQGVPANTTSYTVLLNTIQAAKPDAVMEFGYPGNDTPFLRDLHESGIHFNWVFNVFPGLEFDQMLKTAGADAMKYVYTYGPPSDIPQKVEFGMDLPQFKAAWTKAYPNDKVPFGINSVCGYNTGLVIQSALADTRSLDQMDLRSAVFGLSGKLKTISGTFELASDGQQIGEIMPLAQLVPGSAKGRLKFAVVYPPDQANAKPVYPAPED
jgi:branched-chain amino acid transport system substrate-binding protein